MIRTEMDSMPTELDAISRKIIQLEIEEAGAEQGDGRALARRVWTRSAKELAEHAR